VKAGRCSDAAGTALALSTRAPGYYQQNVESDRDVRTCLAYINAERERAQRARVVTKRRAGEEAPVAAEPAATKRATPPAKAAPAKPMPARTAPVNTDAVKRN
jgi:hypothetical protein